MTLLLRVLFLLTLVTGCAHAPKPPMASKARKSPDPRLMLRSQGNERGGFGESLIPDVPREVLEAAPTQ